MSVRASVEALLVELNATSAEVERKGRVVSIGYTVGSRNRAATVILTTPVDITADPSGSRRSVAVQPTILFHAENARDRLGKSLDVNVEVQTGDSTFDDAVYIESRSPADDVQAVLAEPSVRTSIQTLIAAGTLKLDAPGLQLVLFNYTRLDLGRFEQLADALVTMAAALPRFASGPVATRPPADGYVLPVAVALSVVGVCVALAEGTDVMPIFGTHCALAFFGGVVAWGAVLALLSRVVRGESDSLRRLFAYALILAFTVPWSVEYGLFWGNATFDHSPTVAHTTPIARIYYTTDKHGHRTYHAQVASWHGDGGLIDPGFPSGAARNTHVGEPVLLQVGGGRFGWEWMRSFCFNRPGNDCSAAH